ncbi:MAG: Cytochrome c551 peroxidase [Myxococcota bacterium]|nr:Cytochrome c551 peroxidase [Myxococcota bacterium]
MRFTAISLISLLIVACTNTGPATPPSSTPAPTQTGATQQALEVNKAAYDMFKPLPANFDASGNPWSEPKAELGRMLYFEKRLSKNQDVSCNSCHGLTNFGVDNKKTSPGHNGRLGARNSPSVFNAAGHVAQFWDGRAPTVEEQAKGPILNPVEMAMPSEAAVLAVLKSMPEYVKAFEAAFPGEKDPVTYDNLGKAIGAFERRLVTPSRFDKFLAGDKNALTVEEKAGLNKFIEVNCTMCHSGALAGGGMFMKLGLMVPWPDNKDLGRYEITKNEADKGVFKAPSLRNVEKTGPYFHDGSVQTLEDAIRLMAKHQLNKDLKPDEIASIAAFLKSMTGEIPAALIREPVLPASTDKTPKPDPG